MVKWSTKDIHEYLWHFKVYVLKATTSFTNNKMLVHRRCIHFKWFNWKHSWFLSLHLEADTFIFLDIVLCRVYMASYYWYVKFQPKVQKSNCDYDLMQCWECKIRWGHLTHNIHRYLQILFQNAHDLGSFVKDTILNPKSHKLFIF